MAQWIAAAFLFLLFAVYGISTVKSHVPSGLEFPGDEAYRDMSVARSLRDSGVFGVREGVRMPAAERTLWVLSLVPMRHLTHQYHGAVYMLALVSGLALLFVFLRMSRQCVPSSAFGWAAMLLLVALPGMASAQLSGRPTLMGIALVAAAFFFHIRAIQVHARLLPLSSAAFIGLAMWIDPGYAAWWPVLWIHAAVIDRMNAAPLRFGAALHLRGLSGLLLLLLVVFPPAAWNLSLIRAPWVHGFDAPVPLASWDAGAGALFAAWLAAIPAAVPRSYAAWAGVPALNEPLLLVLFVPSLVGLALLSLARISMRPFLLVPLALAGVPLFHALLAPVLGWSQAPMVFSPAIPLMAATLALAVSHLQDIVDLVKRNADAGGETPEGPLWARMAAAFLVLLVAAGLNLLDLRSAASDTKTFVERQTKTQARLSGVLEAGSGAIATDRPGWLTYYGQAETVDLEGRFHPEILSYMDRGGGIGLDGLAEIQNDFNVAGWSLWSPSLRGRAFAPAAMTLRSPDGAVPEVWTASKPGRS